jgi:hypothetical protein
MSTTTTTRKRTFLQLYLRTFLLLFVNKRIYLQAFQGYVYGTNNKFSVIQQRTASECCTGPIIDNKPKNKTKFNTSSTSQMSWYKPKVFIFYLNSNMTNSNYILSSMIFCNFPQSFQHFTLNVTRPPPSVNNLHLPQYSKLWTSAVNTTSRK